MSTEKAKRLWAGFSGVILGLLLLATGAGYSAPESDKSPWILALGSVFLASGAVILVRSFRKLRRIASNWTPIK